MVCYTTSNQTYGVVNDTIFFTTKRVDEELIESEGVNKKMLGSDGEMFTVDKLKQITYMAPNMTVEAKGLNIFTVSPVSETDKDEFVAQINSLRNQTPEELEKQASLFSKSPKAFIFAIMTPILTVILIMAAQQEGGMGADNVRGRHAGLKALIVLAYNILGPIGFGFLGLILTGFFIFLVMRSRKNEQTIKTLKYA